MIKIYFPGLGNPVRKETDLSSRNSQENKIITLKGSMRIGYVRKMGLNSMLT